MFVRVSGLGWPQLADLVSVTPVQTADSMQRAALQTSGPESGVS